MRFEEGDPFQADVHEATVVTLFLLSRVNEQLRPKLLQEWTPGTRIVSNTFQMGDWKSGKTVTLDGPDGEDAYLSHTLYLWSGAHRATRNEGAIPRYHRRLSLA